MRVWFRAVKTGKVGARFKQMARPRGRGIQKHAAPYGFRQLVVGGSFVIPADVAAGSKLVSLKALCSEWGVRLGGRFECQQLADGSRVVNRVS